LVKNEDNFELEFGKINPTKIPTTAPKHFPQKFPPLPQTTLKLFSKIPQILQKSPPYYLHQSRVNQILYEYHKPPQAILKRSNTPFASKGTLA
jgi:hypothetical protein